MIILVSVVVAVAAAFAYSKIATPKYQSTVLIEMSPTTATGGTATGGTASPVTLPDPVQELGSTAVVFGAAKILKDPNLSALSDSVTGTVDPTTGSLSIVATGSSPKEAKAIATAYATAFVNQIQAVATAQDNKVAASKNQVAAEIATLTAAGATANAAEITVLTQTEATLFAEQFAITSNEPYASIQQAANLPTAPTGLTKSKVLGIGLLAGLLVGIGISLVREQFDNRLRTNSGADAITAAPVLAELPHDSDVRSGKVAIALVQAPQSHVAESIRELRTSLRVIFEDTPCPMIVVTSPEPGDGKTFVAANLATAWAMSGSKVIVVSADFRRPRLEEIFGLQATGLPGLADLIRFNWKNPERDDLPTARRESGSGPNAKREHATNPSLKNTPSRSSRGGSDEVEASSVKSLLFETGIWGLQVLPAGTELDSPSELFGSPGMQPVLDQLPLLADVIIFDTPPVLPVPDTPILARMASGTVVVASEGRTDRHDLERTIHRLENTQCRCLGVALNRVRRASTDSYQSYAFKQ